MEKKKRRNQSLGEEIGNAITHGAGFIFAIVAMILMFIKADRSLEYLGVSIFSIGLLTLYIMSCLYHSFKNDTKVKKVFRVFDHSSIYVLIGGTYAPILLCTVKNPLGLIFFIAQWLIIIIGILVKVLSKKKSMILTTTFCLLLGWSGLIVLPQIYEYSSSLFWYIILGGVAYSGGVAFYLAKFKYAHFVWHFFVLFGTILHFIGIYLFVL